MSDALLAVEDLHTFYDESHVLQGVSLQVRPGQVVALLGRNGAGKTTTMRSIMRMVKPSRGRVTFEGQPIDRLSTFAIASRGISFVQETRAIFPSLSVAENLAIAERRRSRSGLDAWTLDRVYQAFPALYERRGHGGMHLSGGEQQMLAIARGLLGNPRLLLLDEPSEGLAPLIVREIEQLLLRLKAEGLSMLLIEQRFALATSVADAAVVLGKGVVRWQGTVADLRAAEDVKHRWLGL